MSVKSAANGPKIDADAALNRVWNLLHRAQEEHRKAADKVRAARRALEVAEKDEQFVASKLVRFSESAIGSPGAARALDAQPYDERLLKLLKGKQGGWTKPQREGATDAEILKLITVGFKPPRQYGDWADAAVRGGAKPKAWIREFRESSEDKPLLEGLALAKEARRLFEIPEPKAAAAKPAAKKRSRPKKRPAAAKPAAPKKAGGGSGGAASTAASTKGPAAADDDHDEDEDADDARPDVAADGAVETVDVPVKTKPGQDVLLRFEAWRTPAHDWRARLADGSRCGMWQPPLPDRRPTEHCSSRDNALHLAAGNARDWVGRLPDVPVVEVAWCALDDWRGTLDFNPRGMYVPGKTYAPADLELDAAALERAMPPVEHGGLLGSTRPKPGRRGTDYETVGGGRIGRVVEAADHDWAVVACAHAAGKLTYTLQPVERLAEFRGEKFDWPTLRKRHAKLAPEDVPLHGLQVGDPVGEQWVLGDDAERIHVEAPAPEKVATAGLALAAAPPAWCPAALWSQLGDWIRANPDRLVDAGQGRRQVNFGEGARCAALQLDATGDGLEPYAFRPADWPDGELPRWRIGHAMGGYAAVINGAIKAFLGAPLALDVKRAGKVARDAFNAGEADPVTKGLLAGQARARTRARLPEHARPLMDDARVNDDGEFPNPTRIHVPMPPGIAEADVLVVQDAGGAWRSGFRVRWRSAELAGQAPREALPRVGSPQVHATREEAVAWQVDELVAQCDAHAARCPAAMAADVRAFAGALRAYRETLGKPTHAELAEHGYRPQTFGQWMATFRGTMPDDAAYDPADPRIKEFFDQEVRPSEAARAYRVMLDDAGGGAKPAAAPIEIPTPKQAGQKQTFGQWVSSVCASLKGRGSDLHLALSLVTAREDAELVGYYRAGFPASKAGGLLIARATSAPPSPGKRPSLAAAAATPAAIAAAAAKGRTPNGAAHPRDPAALAVGYASHAGAAIPAPGGMVH